MSAPSWPALWCPLRSNQAFLLPQCLQCCTPRTTNTHCRSVLETRTTDTQVHTEHHQNFFSPHLCYQSVPKPPPAPPTKKRKRVIEEPPVVLAPKPLLSGAVPLEAFLTTLQKVRLCRPRRSNDHPLKSVPTCQPLTVGVIFLSDRPSLPLCSTVSQR